MPRFAVSAARSPARRHGFTLVELLVVIAIIGMIIALAVPAIFSATATARNAAVKSELDLLHTALMNYKNEYGSFPPANMQGLWVENVGFPSTVNVRHPVYKHLVRIFPRLNEKKRHGDPGPAGPSPYEELSKMSPAQALVFWLDGFHQNPEYPLTNGGVPGSRKKLFEFDRSRLYAASPYVFPTDSSDDKNPQEFLPLNDPNAAPSGVAHPVYFTPHSQSGAPYVYFDSRCYDTAAGYDVVYFARSKTGVSRASPYLTSLPTGDSNPSWAQVHMNPDSFQLISSGPDGSFGGRPVPPTNRPDPLPYKQASFPGITTFSGTDYPSAEDFAQAPGHRDNLTNYADRPLQAAIEALKKR